MATPKEGSVELPANVEDSVSTAERRRASPSGPWSTCVGWPSPVAKPRPLLADVPVDTEIAPGRARDLQEAHLRVACSAEAALMALITGSVGVAAFAIVGPARFATVASRATPLSTTWPLLLDARI